MRLQVLESVEGHASCQLMVVVAMWLQIMQFAEAEADCDKALKREISVKTLLRRGTARRGKHDLEGARSDFKQVLSLEPKNRYGHSFLRKSPVERLKQSWHVVI